MAAGPRRRSVKTAVQLRISLMEHTPTIWRRLLVPGEITLAKLHMVFQAAMGWEDYHLHYFEMTASVMASPTRTSRSRTSTTRASPWST